MSFKHYRVILRLLSPLHIGKRKYRNLMETREYVPGRTLWGALTARITRDYFDGKSDFYKKIGEFFHQHLRFGYLWPSLDGQTPYFPWKHDAFDYLFKFGYMGQPIQADKKATEEGQLHESEFIAPVTRDNRKVYLVGDLWIKSDILVNESEGVVRLEGRSVPLGKVFSNLQLGGEKGYGWGRVECEKLEPTNGEKAIGNVDFIYKEVRDKDEEPEVKAVREEIVLKFNEGQHITAHALAAEWELPYKDDSKHVSNKESQPLIPASNKEVQGPIEPLTGYEYRGEYSLISNPPICYEPGSKVTSPIVLTVGKFGILHKGVTEGTASQNGDNDKN